MKLKLYLTISYVKYILLILVVFLLIVWLAQIVRYLDLSQSFSMQFSKVVFITSYLLPNAISTILPIIIFIASCFFNYQLNHTNEIDIFCLYLSKNSLKIIILLTYCLLLVFYVINTEIISVKAYNKYKIEEIELRNQFKIVNIGNEIYIKDKLNIIYEKKIQDNSILKNVITYLIDENVVIRSREVEFLQSEKEILFTFIDGKRIASSRSEKSYTEFDKLEYKIVNNNENQISFDKENYNFFELIKNNNVFFKKSAHRKIIDLLMLIFILYFSSIIIFINKKNKNLLKNYSYNLFFIIINFTYISLMTKIFIANIITTEMYYFGNIFIVTVMSIIFKKKYDTL
jgi:lipopolysaccharide export LptBFGC system permease protein LptF